MSDAPARAVRWQPWQMGRLERRDPARRAGAHAQGRRREDQISMALFDLAKEQAEQRGYDAGYADGVEQGYAEGEAKVRAEHEQALADELAATIAPIVDLAGAFRRAAEQLDEQLARQLVELALETGRQLAGRALAIEPEHIVGEIKQLLADYPDLTGAPTLYINIDDHTLVAAQMGSVLAAAGWALRPDMALARGDCRIETQDREIDATHADRWARLLHAVGQGPH